LNLREQNWDSRKDAKHAKYKQNYKFETRNPKFETISNEKKDKISKQNFGSTERFEVFQNLDFF